MSTELGEKINLEKLLDNLPFEIWIKNTEGKYIYVNKFTIKNLGLSKKEIIGKTDFEIRKTEIANNCYLSDKEVLINNKCIYNEEVILNGDCYESFEVYKFPIILDNGKYLLGGCAKEISYKKSFQKYFNNLFMKSSFEEVNLKTFIKNLLNKILLILNCKNVDLYIYNNKERELELYTSSNSNLENFNIKIKEDLLNKIPYNKFKVCKKVSKIIGSYYSDSSKTQGKSYLLEYDNKILGLIFIRYYYNIKYTDDAFLDEICNNLAIIISKIKFDDKLKVDKKNSLTNYLIDDSKNNIINSIDLENLKINFLANISHEFKTPLNIILSGTQLLIKTLEHDEKINKDYILKYLNISKQNSYRILRIINNVLDTTKLQNGFTEVSLKNCNIINIIENIVLSTAEYIKNNGRRIIFDTDIEELILACDPDKIERVVLNLISNSLKFTNNNGLININIRVKENKMFFYIKNDGPAISKEEGKKIFGNFIRSDDILTRKSEGSGIGLYLSKAFIEMHNGEIWANTDISNGAEFIFYIPINKCINTEKDVILNTIENSKIEKCVIEFSDIYL